MDQIPKAVKGIVKDMLQKKAELENVGEIIESLRKFFCIPFTLLCGFHLVLSFS